MTDRSSAPESGGNARPEVSVIGLAARGTVVKTAAAFALKFFTVAQTYFYYRWFTPEDFGYFQFAMMAATIVLLFSQAGFSQAILRGEGDQRHTMDVALTLNLLIGVFFASAILLLGVIMQMAQGQPLQGRLVMLCAYLAFNSAACLPAILWQRHFQFHLDVISQLLNLVVTFVVTYALYRMGLADQLPDGTSLRASCLVWGYISGFVVSNSYIWIFAPYRPKPAWDRDILRTLFHFGWPLFFSALFSYIAWSGDDFFVWLYHGTGEFGLYNRAFIIPMFLASLQDTICQVLIPALKNAQTKEGLHYGFLICNKYMGVLAAFGGLLLFSYARPFTAYFMGGGHWDPAEPMIEIFAISFCLRTLYGWGWWVLPLLRGQNKVIMWANLLYAIGVLTVGQFLIWKWGGLGGAWCNLFVVLCLTPWFRLNEIRREFGSLKSIWAVWPAVVSGLVMCAISRLIFLPYITNNYWLVAFSMLSLLVYATVYLICDRGQILRELRGFARHGLNPGAFMTEER